jgi:hypothetical protein
MNQIRRIFTDQKKKLSLSYPWRSVKSVTQTPFILRMVCKLFGDLLKLGRIRGPRRRQGGQQRAPFRADLIAVRRGRRHGSV